MGFKLIEVSKWKRQEYFDYYLNQVPCTYSMTLNLDLTHLLMEIRRSDIKLYPTMIYLISTIVNQHEEFRTSMDSNKQVGVFDHLHPSYTVFNKTSQTFTNIWTSYEVLFSEFYELYLRDVKDYGEVEKFLAKPNVPANVFYISSIPWVNFTGFNLNLPKVTDDLLPIFTIGKYVEQNDKVWLPIAIQVHHAVCDGYHLCKFIHDLQDAMNNFNR